MRVAGDAERRGGVVDKSDVGDRFEEVFQDRKVCGGGGPMNGQESVRAIEQGKGAEAGDEVGVKSRREVAVGKGDCRVVAGVEVIRDYVEHLGGNAHERHFCGDGGKGERGGDDGDGGEADRRRGSIVPVGYVITDSPSS